MMQTSFNKGFWSAKLQNRFDVEFYRSACSKLDNFNILPQGGITSRAGTKFLLECYDSTKKSILVPFQLDKDSTFIIEFSGNQKMRILQYSWATLTVKQDDHITGFTDDELDEVQWVQIDKHLYVTHKNYVPRKLSRITDHNWLWVPVAHYPSAQRMNRYDYDGTMTLQFASGNDIGFNTGVGWLEEGDAGRFIVARNDAGKAGYAIITSYVDAFTGKCNIIEPFNDIALDTSEWYIQGTGGGRLDPTEYGPEGRKCMIVADGIAGNDHYFRVSDIGRYLEINGGFAEIVKFTDASKIDAVIIKIINDEAATRDFTMFQPEWGQAERHPKTIAFYENRLFYGGTIEKAGTVWGSRSQFLNDFTSHPDDEYTLQYLLTGATLHEILWMVGAQVLMVGTTNGIWTIGREDSSAVLTPTTPMLGYQSTMSCAAIRPATIGNIVFFAQRNKQVLRSFTAGSGVGAEKTTPSDETLFAEPFIDSHINQLVVQSNPHIILWVTNMAGDLWGLNYIQEQQVNSWFKFTTDGLYESIMIYPQEDIPDLLWTTVKRTIDGTTKRYIECFTTDNREADSMKHFTAMGIAYNLTGYMHLKAKNVWVWTSEEGWLRNDNETIHEFTVSATGNIDITGWPGTSNAWAGLPYTSEAKTMNWHGGTDDFSYEQLRRLTKIRATILDTDSGEVGIQVEENTSPEYVKLFDTIPDTIFTGIKELGVHPATGRIMKLCVRQADPASMTLTGLGCNL